MGEGTVGGEDQRSGLLLTIFVVLFRRLALSNKDFPEGWNDIVVAQHTVGAGGQEQQRQEDEREEHGTAQLFQTAVVALFYGLVGKS